MYRFVNLLIWLIFTFAAGFVFGTYGICVTVSLGIGYHVGRFSMWDDYQMGLKHGMAIERKENNR